MQKNFIEAYTNPPATNPLDNLRNRSSISLEHQLNENLANIENIYEDIEKFISSLSIDHTVKPIDWNGGRSAGLGMLGQFIQNGLQVYDEKRNR